MEFLAAVLRADGKQMLSLGGEWPRVESLCWDHQLLGKMPSAMAGSQPQYWPASWCCSRGEQPG